MRLLTDRLAARLSRGRRGRYAGAVVLLLGLLVTGGAYAVLSPAQASDEAADQSTVEQGRALFLVGCASCHGKNGEGITLQNGNQYGPPLVGVGAAAVDFQVGTGRMPMARPGVQAPKKDVQYTDEEIAALAAYVASLGPGPAIPEPEAYDPETIPEEEREEAIVRGGEFFRTNCTACHNFAASGGALPGGKYAPSLKGVEPRHIYEAMLTGPQQMPVFSDGVLTRLTADHSLVAAMVASGVIAPEEAQGHPDSNKVLRSLGSQRALPPGYVDGLEAAYGQPSLLLADGDVLLAHIRESAGDAPAKAPTTYSTVGAGSQILRDLGVRKMRLMSSPMKFNAISGFDLEVVEYVPSE